MTSRPTPVKRYHDYLLQTVNDLNVFNKWFVSPLNLGGVPGEGGGSGVPLAGIVGQLIQSRVAYDTSEAVTLTVPPSGQSLVHNLNRIRYWLNQKSNAIVIQDEGVEVASGVTILDFIGAPVEATLSGGKVLVTISGTGGGGGDTVKVSSDDTVSNYLENKLTAASSKITVTTANPGGNEERQVDLGTVNIDDLNDVAITTPIDNHVLSYDSGGFINQTVASAGIAGLIHTHLEEGITDLEHDAIKIQGVEVSGVAPTTGQALRYDGTRYIPSGIVGGGGSDTKQVLVSSNDTTEGYLEDKVVAGTNVTVTTLNEGSNETLEITASGGGASLEVQEDDVQEVTNVTILNFEGGATVLDEGSGKATITISGGVGGGGVADFTLWMPDAPPATPYSSGGVDDDEFDTGTFNETSIWTVYDEGSRQTETENEFGLSLSQSGTDYFQGIFQPIPGDSDWSFTTCVGQSYSQNDNGVVGIMLLSDISNLDTSDVFVWGTYRGGSGYGWRWAKAPQYNQYTSDSSWINDNKDFAYYLRLRTDGTTWWFDFSTDGYDWVTTIYNQTEEFTPEGVGLGYRVASTSWGMNFKFARFKADSSATQMLYGDRVDMWRA